MKAMVRDFPIAEGKTVRTVLSTGAWMMIERELHTGAQDIMERAARKQLRFTDMVIVFWAALEAARKRDMDARKAHPLPYMLEEVQDLIDDNGRAAGFWSENDGHRGTMLGAMIHESLIDDAPPAPGEQVVAADPPAAPTAT